MVDDVDLVALGIEPLGKAQCVVEIVLSWHWVDPQPEADRVHAIVSENVLSRSGLVVPGCVLVDCVCLL